MSGKTCLVLAAAFACWFAAPASAEEAKAPINPAAILNMFARPVETREAAFDKQLREEPRAPGGTTTEVLGDGTVRYGRATITVKNPCPPGEHYEPPPLPGRRR